MTYSTNNILYSATSLRVTYAIRMFFWIVSFTHFMFLRNRTIFLLVRSLQLTRAFLGHCKLQHSTTNCDAHRAARTFWFVLKNREYIEFHESIVWCS